MKFVRSIDALSNVSIIFIVLLLVEFLFSFDKIRLVVFPPEKWSKAFLVERMGTTYLHLLFVYLARIMLARYSF